MNLLFTEFETICSHLNKVGIIPTLMGSLGLEFVSKVDWDPCDIDIHVPGDPKGWEAPDDQRIDDWDKIRSIMETLEYRLIDVHEHEFQKNKIHVEYGSIDSLYDFAGIIESDIELIQLDGIQFRVPSLKQFLDIYKASSKDSYRNDHNNMKDFKKIAWLNRHLSISDDQNEKDLKITIRPEEHKDYKSIVSLILRSFQEGTDYSDGTDIIALVEEIRDSKYYIPELSFVAELNGEIVGHFLFSHFPLSPTSTGGHTDDGTYEIVMLAPVSVHADHFRQGIGSTMIRMGIEKVWEMGYKGITVEGNYNFYNKIGFRTSSEFGIFPTSGWPMDEPRFMMCQETYEGSLAGIHGYIVYDMYFNA